MATLAVALPTARRSFAASANVFSKETRYEFLKLLRAKTFSLSILGFPVMFYVLFGLSNRHVVFGGVSIAKLLLAGYSCFGLVGAALFGIGVGMATERSVGWLEVKRASPMPPAAYLVAKCITAIAFGLLIVSVLVVLGVLFGDVHLSAVELSHMMLVTVAGSLPFAAMGLLLAQIVPAAAASGIVNLLYLPMSFVSGLWMPIENLPHFVQRIAPLFPTYHLAQLMMTVFGYQRPGGTILGHCLNLAGFTALMLLLSWRVFERAEQKA